MDAISIGLPHMAAATILHIGEDFCRRIPVLERAGFAVFESEGSIAAVEKAFVGGDIFSAITFHCDLAQPPDATLRKTRTLSVAPCVLFANPAIQVGESEFELVIPALTSPDLWLKRLRELIEASRRLLEQSRQLRQDCAGTRSATEMQRARSEWLRINPIDADAIWRGDPGDPKD